MGVLGRNRRRSRASVSFDFVKEERRVGVYYFYILDREFGPGFIKICTYFPYPAKVWLNGHEWAKRQADARGDRLHRAGQRLRQPALSPSALQAICDQLRARPTSQAFFDRWIAVIPTPFTAADRAAGYWWELSMRQVEVSRTLVFDDPRRARGFFEALVADNIGIGRPEQVALVFARQLRRPTTATRSATRIFSPAPRCRSTSATSTRRVKQYLKDGRALRIETVDQQASRPRRPRPPRAPARADRQGPRSQPAAAYDRACRPELCHRLCALRAHPPALPHERANEPEPCASATHAPWPWPAPSAASSTPSPASPTKAFAGSSPDSSAQDYSAKPDELRPPPPTPPRAHRTPPAHATPTRSPPTASASPSSTPSSKTGCSAPYSTPTNRPPRSTSAARSRRSKAPSPTTSTTRRLAPAAIKLVTTSRLSKTKSN